MKINADNLIAGRFATVAAKSALLGENVEIINCATAVIGGDRKRIFAEYQRKRNLGTHRKGPFFIRQPDRFVKRLIRGMLPHRQDKGAKALKRIMCYSGVPAGAKVEDYQSIEAAHVGKLKSTKFVTIRDICRNMGGK